MRRGRKGVFAKLLACSTVMLSARPLLPRPGCCPHPRHGLSPTLPRRLTLNPGRHPLLYHLHQLSLPPPRPSWRQVAVWPSKPTSLPSSPVHRLTLGALPPPIVSSGRRIQTSRRPRPCRVLRLVWVPRRRHQLKMRDASSSTRMRRFHSPPRRR